jgi:Zinc finger, C3HC4 type (RING finger)
MVFPGDRQPEPVSLSQPDYYEDEDDSDYEGDGQEVDDTGSSDESSDFSRSASPFSPIDDNDDDATNLYADMDSEEAPVFLAHLQRPWLTRNRYGPIVNPSSRTTVGSRQEDEESRRNCVICTVEPRVIICWPCRCLALCDDCRGGLAARSTSSKHHCPCCRQRCVLVLFWWSLVSPAPSNLSLLDADKGP